MRDAGMSTAADSKGGERLASSELGLILGGKSLGTRNYGRAVGLRLKGRATKRGGHPSLRAVFRPRPGHANTRRLIVRSPRSAFLDQAHIRTRVHRRRCLPQRRDLRPRRRLHAAAGGAPARPLYLSSSSSKLPDLVFDLKGIVDIEASARIDSIRGGIRTIFPAIPDAPISKVVLRMQGGNKGLIVNSRHLCQGKARASVRFDAHNGKRRVLRPVACKEKRGKRGSPGGR